MKVIWKAFIVLLLLHIVAALGFVGWMYSTDRISKDRLSALVDMFKPTIAQEQAQQQKLAEELAKQKQDEEDAVRMAQAKEGPLTLNDRMSRQRESEETVQLKLDRLDRARQDIQGQIERAQNMLAEENQKLEQARADFEKFINQRTEQLRDEDFQKAVAMLEQQQPGQAKAMLQSMLAAGDQKMVVNYLAAMQERKAAKVLAEFKTPDEVPVAAGLVEALRLRGMFQMPTAADNNTAPAQGGHT